MNILLYNNSLLTLSQFLTIHHDAVTFLMLCANYALLCQVLLGLACSE